MSMLHRRLAYQCRFRGQEGQSLLETAIAMPLLLGLAFNIINWAYLWFMVLALSAAPRMGPKYATQRGPARTATRPGTPALLAPPWCGDVCAVPVAITCHLTLIP